MTLFSGPCTNGPCAGLPLHHGEPQFWLVKRDTNRVQAYQTGYELKAGEELGAYYYVDDHWEWKREQSCKPSSTPSSSSP